MSTNLTGEDFERALKAAFEAVVFEPGELAFLAATSKIEHPIRDRLSWRVQQELPEYDVVREWQRVDVAVLKNERPVAVVELKAMYTWDATQKNHQLFVEAIANDERKALALVGPMVPIFTILLATHPRPADPRSLRPFFKYVSGIKAALRGSTPDAVAALAERVVSDSFILGAPRRLAFRHLLAGEGESFGVPFDVYAWCFRYMP